MSGPGPAVDATPPGVAQALARLQELDALDESGSARDQQYADQLSGIQDLDYVKAISVLTQKQMMLQAAQQSAV